MNIQKPDNNNNSESKSIDKLSSLYEEGIKNKDKISYSLLFNSLVISLSSISAICIGIVICYIFYVFC